MVDCSSYQLDSQKPVCFQNYFIKKYSFKPIQSRNSTSKQKKYYFMAQTLLRTTCLSMDQSKKAKVSFAENNKSVQTRTVLARKSDRRSTKYSTKSTKVLQKSEPRKIWVRKKVQVNSNYQEGYKIPMSQYIQEWRTLKQSKDIQKASQTSYQAWNKASREENSSVQNKLLKRKTTNYERLLVKSSFNLAHFPKIFRKPQKQLNGNANLSQFNSLIVVNTQNYCFFETQIDPKTDYRNYLANNAFRLKKNQQNNRQIKHNIYFCALDGIEVQSENFFWISCVLNCNQRPQVISYIRKFLNQIFNQTAETDYDYLIDSTIWIVDWKGRVSYLKIKQIDIPDSIRIQEQMNVQSQQPFEEKSKNLSFNRNSIKRMVWDYSGASSAKSSLHFINIV